MDFTTDIAELKQNKRFSIKIEDVTLPNNTSVFFRAKQEEIYRQYESARLFLQETEYDSDCEHWFNKTGDSDQDKVFALLIREKMFEAALLFYNIVVDLSWVLCYVSAEYVTYANNQAVSFEKLIPIEDAYKLLRNTEKNIENPNADGNPFGYLKNRRPEFEDSINLILDFWKHYGNSSLRGLYNFVKHRGKPLYEEIENEMGAKFMGMVVGGQSCPTDVRDVQRSLSLAKSIDQLKEFDDKMLFPYIKKLLRLLEKVVDPSPFVM